MKSHELEEVLDAALTSVVHAREALHAAGLSEAGTGLDRAYNRLVDEWSKAATSAENERRRMEVAR